MRIKNVLLLATIASLPAIGCGSSRLSPEAVPVDRVECARCRMLISTDGGAAEIVSRREATRFYDDVGCMAADWPAHRDQAAAFVRLADGTWSEASLASYARPKDARTAMGSGIVAVATLAQARLTDRDGRALVWDDVVTLSGGHR